MPSAPLTQWNAALANRAAVPARWLGIGESLQEGQGASTEANRFFNKALGALRGRYPIAGVAGGRNYIPARRRVYGPDSESWINGVSSYTGSLSLISEGFANTGHKTVNMPVRSTMTFTVSGTSVDLDYVVGPGGGNFTYRVDNGPTVTVSSNGSYRATAVKRVVFPSRGVHTVKIACSTTPVYFSGVFLYDQDETRGIHGYDGGWSSATVATPFLQDLGAGGWTDTLKHLSLDLVTIELNGNDVLNGTPLTTFRGQAQQLVGTFKALPKVPSIVWLTSYQVAAGVSSNSAGPYDQVIKDLAAADPSIGVLSWYDEIDQVGTGSSLGLFQPDGIHPNDAGHQVLADSLVRYLTA